MNQRRRRPVRKRDGTFNYSPDVYCTKFDETTGVCPDGDECPFLHRTAGDTERRYHLRYYKTGTCVYETDPKGHCVKNGPHCAFAHGALDLRPPVYDIRELQSIDTSDKSSSSPGTPSSSSLEKDRVLIEDPRWNDTNFVLANYKTETCKRPPRLCRQGYACPQYHNSRDRRRSPKLFKYRSTPCPNVKHGDEWGDPVQCENGDNCGYCHTRTEQQFHPEIYKSTKCNDMVQTNCCPRGPFCAFAHVEHEMTTQRDIAAQGSTILAAMISNLLPQSSVTATLALSSIPIYSPSVTSYNQAVASTTTNGVATSLSLKIPDPIGKERTYSTSVPAATSTNVTNNIANHSVSPLPEPIGKGRSSSTSSSITSNDSGTFYQRAPGSEREDVQGGYIAKLKQQLQAIDNDQTLDEAEKAKRKQNLILVHSLSFTSNSNTIAQLTGISTQGGLPVSVPTSMSPFAPAFYPPRETVGSVVEQALEDITLDDIDINSIDKELDNDTNSLSSSISAGLSSGFGSSSLPIGIPPCTIPRGSVGSLSQSPPSPYGSFQHSILPMHTQKDSHTDTSYLQHNHMKFSGSPFGEINSMSPRSGPGGPNSPLYSQTLANSLSNSQNSEVHKLQLDLTACKTRLDHWEQAYNQAKLACEAWKKEAEESVRKAKLAEEDKQQMIKQRDEALSMYKKVKMESNAMKTTGGLRYLQHSPSELESYMIPQLQRIQEQLRCDLNKVEQVIYKQTASKCLTCHDNKRTIATLPCNHMVMCDKCAATKSDCPLCHIQITQRNSIQFSV